MRTAELRCAMRFAGAFVGAVAVVLAMLVSGLKVSGRFPSERAALEFQNVDVLSESKRRDFAELLEAPQQAPTLPPLEDIPALDIRHRQRGFVQAEVAVDRTGRVTDVDIIDATPPGVYEQRAIEELRAKRYPPALGDTAAVASRRLEIVDFFVPDPQGAQP